MKKIFIFFCIFLLGLNTLFANAKLRAQKSHNLVGTLIADGFPHLAILEIDDFLKNFPQNEKRKDLIWLQAQLFNQLQQYSDSQKTINLLSLENFAFAQTSQILFLQAKNLFFQQKFSDSLIFLQNLQESPKDAHSKFFYTFVIYLFLENLSFIQQNIQEVPLNQINAKEKEFFSRIKWNNPESIVKLSELEKWDELEKLVLIILASELENKKKNYQKSLDFLNFHSQQDNSIFSKYLLNFFIGKNFYQLSLDSSYDNYTKEAQKFLTQYQKESEYPLPQSYLYLGNFYAAKEKYQLAYEQYSNLLPLVEYVKILPFILNYVEISNFLEEYQNTEQILLRTLENNQNLTQKYQLQNKLLELYSKQEKCDAARSILLQNASNNNFVNSKQNQFLIGDCYYKKNDFFNAKIHFLSIPLTHALAIKSSRTLVEIFALENDELGFFNYFSQINASNKNFLNLEKNKLYYYYIRKNWNSFLNTLTKLEKAGLVTDIEIKKLLANVYEQKKDKKSALKVNFDLLQQDLTRSEKTILAEKLLLSYKKRKNYTQIAKVYEVLRPDFPSNDKLQIELLIAKNYLLAKKTALALKWFRTVAYRKNIKKFPNYKNLRSEAFYYIGEVYYSQKKYKSALSVLGIDLKRINNKNTWYIKIQLLSAQAYSALKEWKKALQHYAIVAKYKTPEGKIARNNSQKIKDFLKSQNSNTTPKQ